MPRFIPGLGEARDLLLVFGVVAVLIGSSAIAAGLTTVGHGPARVAAAARVVTPAPPPPIARRSVQPACDCDASRRLWQSPPPPAVQRSIPPEAPQPVHAPEQSRSIESSSFHEWLRTETDLRYILRRMSMMSRHVPRSYTTETTQ